jgi:hypothetical protein
VSEQLEIVDLQSDLPEGMEVDHAPLVSTRVMFSGHVPDDTEISHIVELGGGLRIKDDRKIELTHTACYTLLELPEFVVNDASVDRDLMDSHVTYLLGCMKGGIFHTEWVQIITCFCKEPIVVSPTKILPAGSEYRMNGQHTAWARLGMPDIWPCPVRRIKYEADTIADMRRLYASIDRGKGRSSSNVLDSYLAGTELFAGTSRRLLHAIAAGFDLWQHGYGSGKPKDEVAFKLQTSFADITRKVLGYYKTGSKNDRMMRASVVAAVYETFTKLPTKAADFWDPVRDGLGFTGVNDPRKRLRELYDHVIVMGFRRRTSLSGRNAGGTERAMSSEDLYRAGIYCWNCWREGREMKAIKTPTTANRPTTK